MKFNYNYSQRTYETKNFNKKFNSIYFKHLQKMMSRGKNRTFKEDVVL